MRCACCICQPSSPEPNQKELTILDYLLVIPGLILAIIVLIALIPIFIIAAPIMAINRLCK